MVTKILPLISNTYEQLKMTNDKNDLIIGLGMNKWKPKIIKKLPTANEWYQQNELSNLQGSCPLPVIRPPSWIFTITSRWEDETSISAGLQMFRNKQFSLPVGTDPESNWTQLLSYLMALSSDGQLVAPSDNGTVSRQRNLPMGGTAYGIPCKCNKHITELKAWD